MKSSYHLAYSLNFGVRRRTGSWGLAGTAHWIDTHSSIRYQVGMKTFSRVVLVSTLFAALNGLRAADAPAAFKVSEFTFTRSANWEWVETASAMRKAELRVVEEKTKAKAE